MILSKFVQRTAGLILAAIIGIACASPAPEDPNSEGLEQSLSQSDQAEQDDLPPIDEDSLLLQFGELLAEVAFTGGDALERTLTVSAGSDFDPSCAPLWAHELLETIDDSQTAVELAPGGISVRAVLVPAEVQFGRAVHLGGDCDGRLAQPERPNSDEPSDPPLSSDPVEAQASPEPEPTPDPTPQPEPTPEPTPQPEPESGNVVEYTTDPGLYRTIAERHETQRDTTSSTRGDVDVLAAALRSEESHLHMQVQMREAAQTFDQHQGSVLVDVELGEDPTFVVSFGSFRQTAQVWDVQLGDWVSCDSAQSTVSGTSYEASVPWSCVGGERSLSWRLAAHIDHSQCGVRIGYPCTWTENLVPSSGLSTLEVE